MTKISTGLLSSRVVRWLLVLNVIVLLFVGGRALLDSWQRQTALDRERTRQAETEESMGILTSREDIRLGTISKSLNKTRSISDQDLDFLLNILARGALVNGDKRDLVARAEILMVISKVNHWGEGQRAKMSKSLVPLLESNTLDSGETVPSIASSIAVHLRDPSLVPSMKALRDRSTGDMRWSIESKLKVLEK